MNTPRIVRAARGTRLSAKSWLTEAPDIVLWDIERPADLVYDIGVNRCHAIVKRGIARAAADLLSN